MSEKEDLKEQMKSVGEKLTDSLNEEKPKRGRRKSTKPSKKELEEEVQRLKESEDKELEVMSQQLLGSGMQALNELWKRFMTDSEHGLTDQQIGQLSGSWTKVMMIYSPDLFEQHGALIMASTASVAIFGQSYLQYMDDRKKKNANKTGS